MQAGVLATDLEPPLDPGRFPFVVRRLLSLEWRGTASMLPTGFASSDRRARARQSFFIGKKPARYRDPLDYHTAHAAGRTWSEIPQPLRVWWIARRARGR